MRVAIRAESHRTFVPIAEPTAQAPRLVRQALARQLPFLDCQTVASHAYAARLMIRASQVQRGSQSAQPPERLGAEADLTLIDEAKVASALVDAQYSSPWEHSHIQYKLPTHEIPQALSSVERRHFLQEAENLQLLPVRSTSQHQQALYYLPAQPKRGLSSLVPLQPRLVLPTQHFRNGVMAMMHNSPYGGHFGIKRTYAKVAQRYYWKGMADDITAWIAG